MYPYYYEYMEPMYDGRQQAPGAQWQGINQRLTRLERTVDRQQRQIDRLQRQVDRLDNRVDRIERRLGY